MAVILRCSSKWHDRRKAWWWVYHGLRSVVKGEKQRCGILHSNIEVYALGVFSSALRPIFEYNCDQSTWERSVLSQSVWGRSPSPNILHMISCRVQVSHDTAYMNIWISSRIELIITHSLLIQELLSKVARSQPGYIELLTPSTEPPYSQCQQNE